MNICVFCSSSDEVDGRLLEQARLVGRQLAGRGHALVYGGTPMGTMAALADGVRQSGGRVTAVVPVFMQDLGIADEACDELVITDDLLGRKREMMARSDGFVALPGGLGTVDELLEVITHIYLGQLQAPVALLDAEAFWDPLLRFFRGLAAYGVSQVPPADLLRACTTTDEAFAHLESTHPTASSTTVWRPSP